MNALRAISQFLQDKSIQVIAFVQALIGLLLGFEVIHWTSVQIGLVMTLLSAFLAFFDGRVWSKIKDKVARSGSGSGDPAGATL